MPIAGVEGEDHLAVLRVDASTYIPSPASE